MKKLLLLLLIPIMSCVERLDFSENPFVVTSVHNEDLDENCYYRGERQYHSIGIRCKCIYAVGDTIKFCN